MKALVIADTHGKLMQRELKEVITQKPDIMFLLGDISSDDLDAIQSFHLLKDVTVFGVVGNHEDPDILSQHSITDIHRITYCYNGITIGGYGGSIKYKDTDFYMLHTNDESEQELAKLEVCDILICHDKPCFQRQPAPRKDKIKKESSLTFWEKLFGRKQEDEEFEDAEQEKPIVVHAHSGLTGLGQYIERAKPRLVLHGHIHDRTKTMHGSTEIRCCYGIELIEI